jgi:hypothetical protein
MALYWRFTLWLHNNVLGNQFQLGSIYHHNVTCRCVVKHKPLLYDRPQCVIIAYLMKGAIKRGDIQKFLKAVKHGLLEGQMIGSSRVADSMVCSR